MRLSSPTLVPAPTATLPAVSAVPETYTQPYHARLAATSAEREAAFRLRFRVFNLELNEGLEQAFSTGADVDEFDPFCDHVIVEDRCSGDVVGTYRLQSGASAARHIGYYSAREFDFAPYEPIRDEIIELGRACIHPEHRKYEVLMLLWKVIAHYAVERGARYLVGCSSLTSQDPAEGAAVFEKLKPTLAPEPLRTSPLPGYAFDLNSQSGDVSPPKLLRTYLALGANICGAPAMDREFKTIDFLTLMDLNNLSPAIRNRLM
jgi:putative hemolysin